jgi:hypothetical protein
MRCHGATVIELYAPRRTRYRRVRRRGSLIDAAARAVYWTVGDPAAAADAIVSTVGSLDDTLRDVLQSSHKK